MQNRLLWGFLAFWTCISTLHAEPVEVPIDIGVGPSLFYMPGVTEGQNWHTGFRFDAFAVIDQATIRKHKNRIPKQYRGLAASQKEIRIAPAIFYLIPDAVFLSPGPDRSVYGANWNILGIGISLISGYFADIKLALDIPTLTYAYVISPELKEGKQHLFGVGATPAVVGEWHLSDSWVVETAYRHALQLPLETNRAERENGSSRQWSHYGECSILLHYRFPYHKNL